VEGIARKDPEERKGEKTWCDLLALRRGVPVAASATRFTLNPLSSRRNSDKSVFVCSGWTPMSHPTKLRRDEFQAALGKKDSSHNWRRYSEAGTRHIYDIISQI